MFPSLLREGLEGMEREKEKFQRLAKYLKLDYAYERSIILEGK